MIFTKAQIDRLNATGLHFRKIMKNSGSLIVEDITIDSFRVRYGIQIDGYAVRYPKHFSGFYQDTPYYLNPYARGDKKMNSADELVDFVIKRANKFRRFVEKNPKGRIQGLAKRFRFR